MWSRGGRGDRKEDKLYRDRRSVHLMKDVIHRNIQYTSTKRVTK